MSSLQQEVSDLKKNDNMKQQQSRKRPRDGDGLQSQLIHRDGNDNNDHNLDEGSDSDPEPEIEDPSLPSDSGTTGSVSLSEEGEAFFETIFSKRMEYATQKAKVAKYSQPDSRWTKCPQLDPVVEGILSSEALKQDKVAYKSQEL